MKRFLLTIAVIPAVLAGGLYYVSRPPVLTALCVKAVNLTAPEYLKGPVRLKLVSIDRSLRLRVEGIQAVIKTETGDFPFELEVLESRESLYRIFSEKGVLFDLRGFRPRNSSRRGAEGVLQFKAGRQWFAKAEIEVLDFGLEDVRWLDPQNLDGASGAMKGFISAGSDYRDQVRFAVSLTVPKPGGALKEKFFESLKPYLPGVNLKKGQTLIGYDEAILRLTLESSDTIKGFLHIRIPEYNLNLNLNLEVRIDEENGFSKLLSIMGLIRVKT